MALLYADENFPLPAVARLRTLGHDVLTAVEARKAGQGIDDDEVLAFASSAKRAVLTRDRRDFIRLHNSGLAHEGVIVCSDDLDFVAQADRIHDAMAQAGSLSGRLLRVNNPP